MIWYVEGASFFLAFASIITGFGVVIFGYCLKSRCSKFVCCSKEGFLIVIRDSLAENEELKLEILGLKKNSSEKKDEIPLLTRDSENVV